MKTLNLGDIARMTMVARERNLTGAVRRGGKAAAAQRANAGHGAAFGGRRKRRRIASGGHVGTVAVDARWTIAGRVLSIVTGGTTFEGLNEKKVVKRMLSTFGPFRVLTWLRRSIWVGRQGGDNGTGSTLWVTRSHWILRAVAI